MEYGKEFFIKIFKATIGKVLTEMLDRYDRILSRQGEALAKGIYA